MTTKTSIYEYAKQGLQFSKDKIALWFYGKSITYLELFHRIDNVADNLYGLGVRKGTVVTIHLPNCPQAVVAIYAVAKLGGICNMVHPLTPYSALRSNMIFTESRILITGDHLSRCTDIDFADTLIYVNLSAHMGVVYGTAFRMKVGKKRPSAAVAFEMLEKHTCKEGEIPPQEELYKSCAVYLNSSGTTGKPKIVMHSHEACNNWVEDARIYFRGRRFKDDTFLTVLPFFHGAGLVLNLHLVLSDGGTQVLMAKWNSGRAVKEIRTRSVTVLTGVPSMYQSLLKNRKFSKTSAKTLAQCYISGDTASLALKEALDTRIGRRVAFEGYGMTEVVTACFSISAYYDRIEASGYPLANCFVAVLTENDELCHYGTGELLISTNTMMIGYLKDPAATEQFFLHRDGQKWCRTGDYGTIDEEGYVYFQQRIKDIIIRNGYNVYPREVEEVIEQLENVSDVAVIGHRQSGTKGEDICAFIATDITKGEDTLRNMIRKACAADLPGYSVPNRIVFMKKIPRNSMGKADKQELKRLL